MITPSSSPPHTAGRRDDLYTSPIIVFDSCHDTLTNDEASIGKKKDDSTAGSLGDKGMTLEARVHISAFTGWLCHGEQAL